jgi:hypothetical protein
VNKKNFDSIKMHGLCVRTSLCVSVLTIKQIAYYVTNRAISHNYLYFVMATCFGLSLRHLQAKIQRCEVQSVRITYCGIPFFLQGNSVTVSTAELEQNSCGVINCVH